MAFPQLSSRYHSEILKEREWAAKHGGFRDRVRFDLVDRPQYAFGVLAAADIARFCGVGRITVIEFGVAEGKGLFNLCALAEEVSHVTDVRIEVVGFDTGQGLPRLEDYRDHPEIWSEGDFGGIGQELMESKLPYNARMVWGDVRDTLREAVRSLRSPVGFVANDLDLYSSTLASLSLFDAPIDKLLPVVITYFDDTLGSPTRMGSLFRNRWCGQLAAIDDFNLSHQRRKIDQIRTLKARRPLDRELWLDQMYAVHAFDHPLRQAGSRTQSMSMDAHGEHDRMAWPL